MAIQKIMSQKTLLLCILFLGVTFAAEFVMPVNQRASSLKFFANQSRLANGTLHPLYKVQHQLDLMDWKDEVVEAYIRQTWSTNMDFMEVRKKKFDGEKKKREFTTITTSCHDTSPWVVVSLLEVPKMKTIRYGVSRLPDDSSLVVYNNTDKPRSVDPEPIIQSIRSFISSRPRGEEIVLQADMCQVVPDDARTYVDHHIMIHIYDGQVNLYQSWYKAFTLLDWMGDAGSFDTRYPMDLETWLYHYEIFLAPFATEEEVIQRQISVWKIFGRTATLEWTVDKKGNPVIDDYIAGTQLDEGWVVPLITYWPNALKTTVTTEAI